MEQQSTGARQEDAHAVITAANKIEKLLDTVPHGVAKHIVRELDEIRGLVGFEALPRSTRDNLAKVQRAIEIEAALRQMIEVAYGPDDARQRAVARAQAALAAAQIGIIGSTD